MTPYRECGHFDYATNERRWRLWRTQHQALLGMAQCVLALLATGLLWAVLIPVGAFMWKLTH